MNVVVIEGVGRKTTELQQKNDRKTAQNKKYYTKSDLTSVLILFRVSIVAKGNRHMSDVKLQKGIKEFLKQFRSRELSFSDLPPEQEKEAMVVMLETLEEDPGIDDRLKMLLIYTMIIDDHSVPVSKAFYLSKMGNKNDPDACYLMGLCYWDSVFPFPEDDVSAYTCFQQAYDGGVQEASEYLIEACYDGRGTQKDNARVLSLIGDDNSKESKKYRGLCYIESGKTYLGLSLVRSSAQEGDADACYRLGIIYKEGVYFKKNDELAYHYFVIGAMRDDERCKLNAGIMSFTGTGTQRDSSVAFYYLRDIKKDKLANEILGDIMMEHSCFKKAEKYYKEAMKQGNVVAGRKHGSLLLESPYAKTRKEGVTELRNIAHFDSSAYMVLYSYHVRNGEPHLAKKALHAALEARELLAYDLLLLSRREIRKIMAVLAVEAKIDEKARQIFETFKEESRRRKKALKAYYKL